MKTLSIITLLIFSFAGSIAQTVISGTVKTKNNQPVAGANVAIAHTYDGASTDTAGHFSFSTDEKGKLIIRYSAIGLSPDSVTADVNGSAIHLSLIMNEATNELNVVTITAGTLEASDTKKGAVLNSLDIATTAGAVADVISALQTLPGTSQAFGENGLFVRGGAASETQTYFDGLLVKDPFGSQLPDLSSRSRFSPFLFKGTTFSSGGYSAQYGQALSSALLLETKDLPEKTSTEFSILTVGIGAAHTEKMANSSLTVGANYYNLSPAFSLIKQNVHWDTAPNELIGNIQYKLKPTKNGFLKFFGQFDNNSAALFTNNTDSLQLTHIINHNKNFYLNSSYQDMLGQNWKINGGIAYGNTHEAGFIDTNAYRKNTALLEGRFTLTHYLGAGSLIRAGAEAANSSRLESWNAQSRNFTNQMSAGFAEGEFRLNNLLIMRAGLRTEYEAFNNGWTIAPRLSIGIKTGAKSQVSLAYGKFYQNPDEEYLIQNKNLNEEKADHYLLNYQYLGEGRTFRIEAFYKNYSGLTKYDFNGIPPDYSVVNYTNLNNGGSGYAKGIDIFWRDKKTIPGGDYYISYSYLDTKRDFRNYPAQSTPPFAAKNTLNIVYKQYIPSITSEIGFTYSYSSGRTYYNPNNPMFLADETRGYNNLSFNISYLTRVLKQFAVIYASASNLPGFKNIYGYNYSADGRSREPITPAARRDFIVGLLVTIGDNTFNH